MTESVWTQTRDNGRKLVRHLKAAPSYEPWWKLGELLDIDNISSVVSDVRDDEKLYGGTIPYVELGPTLHLKAFVWPAMPVWYRRLVILHQTLTEQTLTRRFRVTAMTDEIIGSGKVENSMAMWINHVERMSN
jgi:hypothetical protein